MQTAAMWGYAFFKYDPWWVSTNVIAARRSIYSLVFCCENDH